MTGLIPAQIGLAAKVRPQGALKASWEAFVAEQVERDEALRAEPVRPLLKVREQVPRFALAEFFRGCLP